MVFLQMSPELFLLLLQMLWHLFIHISEQVVNRRLQFLVSCLQGLSDLVFNTFANSSALTLLDPALLEKVTFDAVDRVA